MCLNKASGGRSHSAMQELFVSSPGACDLGNKPSSRNPQPPEYKLFKNISMLTVDSYLLVVIGVCEYMLVSDLNSVNVIL